MRPDVWLARHGATDWSAAGKHTGRTDIPLNDNGRRAARTLATVLRAERFDLVLVSPMQRAQETCRLAGFGEQAQVDANLREWDYGDYEGITTDEIRQQRPGWTVFADGCPGGETLAEVGARADLVIERVLANDGRALLFGHGHGLRILAARWIDLSPAGGERLSLGTASVSVLGWEHESGAITRWNANAD
jgi:broad specificity phosphatase PhoE